MKPIFKSKSKLYSEKTGTGKHNYFIDIKQSTYGDPYLSITETFAGREGFERRHVIIFNTDVDQFIDSVNRAFRELQVFRKTRGKNSFQKDPNQGI